MNIETSLRIFEAVIEDIKKSLVDCQHVGFPEIIEIDPEDLETYQKQECSCELFKYEYVNQGSCGDSGDSFDGYMAYPLEGNKFIHVYFAIS